MSDNTGVIRYGSELERKSWMVQGMIQKKSESFWNGLKGKTQDSVIYQKNDRNASEGMTVVFDYRGNLATEGFRGSEEAFGNAKAKYKFSDKLTIEEGIYTVDNGRKYDAAIIGDMDLAEHEDSRELLSDNQVRANDQVFFDVGCGFLRGETPSHILTVADKSVADMTVAHKISWDFLVEIETAAKTGKIGTYDRRAPIRPFKFAGGKRKWLCILDSYQIMDLLQDTKFQALYQNAQVRGNGNELISHAIAEVGNLVIMEAGTFFGSSSSNELFKQSVEMAGLRTIDEAGTFSGTTTKQAGVIASRGLLLGAGAFQEAFGMMPDYKYQPSQDFGRVSESALELWHQAKRCVLTAEVKDYEEAKIAEMDYAMFVFDTYNAQLTV